MIAAALLACAVQVHPVTLQAVARVESSFNPLAINVNRLQGPQPHTASVEEAARIAKSYISRGYSVDLGILQVNSRNLHALGYTVEEMFDPCKNITAGGRILSDDYARAITLYQPGQDALIHALSAYNSGSWIVGMQNGYVAKYVSVPQLTAPVIKASAVSHVRRPPAPANPYAADTEVRWSNALLASSN